MREYSHLEAFVNNLPYTVMTLLGSTMFVLGLETTLWAWIAAGAYLAYGVIGAFWIMIWVCPYCSYYGSRSCPCGYGKVSAKLRPKAASECFNEKFKRHIPVIVPLWFIPLVAGGVIAAYRFSWPLLGCALVFGINSFVILPLVSMKHGCTGCPQKDTCPWMRKRG